LGVEPRVSLSGISGLSTVLQGNYIGFQAGKSAESQRMFTGLDAPPNIVDQPGRQFVLTAKTIGLLAIGAPVYYRSISVGAVAGYNLAADGKSVEISVFVNAPYDKYVSSRTRFWNVSGVHATAGADGVDIQTESLIAVLAGGLAFDAPDDAVAALPAAPNAVFTLFRDRAAAMKEPERIEQYFLLYFDESVRGLSVGAPVTLFGLPVGQVAEVGLSFDSARLVFRPRVLISFYPERLLAHMSAGDKVSVGIGGPGLSSEFRRVLRRLVEERGLRAQLLSGNLLTGELYVALDYFPSAPKPKISWNHDPQELPVVRGGLTTIEGKLTNILTKIDNMPLDAIGADTKAMLESLQQTLKDADSLVSAAAPAIPEGTRTLEQLHRAIADADRTLFSKDANVAQDMHDTLQEMTHAARSVQGLVDYLERHPESLVRGKPEERP
jgi:paraquat-inducible protein B